MGRLEYKIQKHLHMDDPTETGGLLSKELEKRVQVNACGSKLVLVSLYGKRQIRRRPIARRGAVNLGDAQGACAFLIAQGSQTCLVGRSLTSS
jgi:hypothetical protein